MYLSLMIAVPFAILRIFCGPACVSSVIHVFLDIFIELICIIDISECDVPIWALDATVINNASVNRV